LKGFEGTPKNVDGAVKDEDMFVLGDDEDEAPSEEEAPPAHAEAATTPTIPEHETPATEAQAITSHSADHTAPTSPQYYIKPGDTLQGIALRFGINASRFSFTLSSNSAYYRPFIGPTTLSTQQAASQYS